MLAIAADVGYSETAFLKSPRPTDHGPRRFDVKYWSSEAEVPFCGHATVAAAIALAAREGPGEMVFGICSGDVPVRTQMELGGSIAATLTSVVPQIHDVSAEDVRRVLALLRWNLHELDPAFPPKIAYAGVRHLVLAAAARERLARLDYDYDGLKGYMLERDLTTVDLVWRESQTTFHARNPFPVGGVVEDPADRRRGRRLRRLSAPAGCADRAACARDHHPGRGHGTPQHAARRHRCRAARDPRHRPGGADRTLMQAAPSP